MQSPAPTFNNLSKEFLDKHIVPLEPGEEAIYRLITSGKVTFVDDDDIRYPPASVLPDSFRIPSTFAVLDPFANGGNGAMVEIANATRTKVEAMPGGGSHYVPNAEELFFLGMMNCEIRVNSTQRHTFLTMELHPNNENCVTPDRITSALFYRVDEITANKKQVLLNEKRNAARRLIELAGPEEKLHFAEYLRVDNTPDRTGTGKERTYMRLTNELYKLCDAKPQAVLDADITQIGRIADVVKQMFALEVLVFDEQTRTVRERKTQRVIGGSIEWNHTAEYAMRRYFVFTESGKLDFVGLSDVLEEAITRKRQPAYLRQPEEKPEEGVVFLSDTPQPAAAEGQPAGSMGDVTGVAGAAASPTPPANRKK